MSLTALKCMVADISTCAIADALEQLKLNGFVDTFRYAHDDEKKFTFWQNKNVSQNKDKGVRLDYFLINEE